MEKRAMGYSGDCRRIFHAHDNAFDCGKWQVIALCAPEIFTETYRFENQIEWLTDKLRNA